MGERMQEVYISGAYLERNPDWHADESPWKARQILRMLARHRMHPRTICEVGCGAGEVLRQLQASMDNGCEFWGYEISPVAFNLCRVKANERLHFKLADFTRESVTPFDLILVLDVIEHLEDYFNFLRDIQPKATYKIFHVPLDLSVQTVLRGNALIKRRDEYAHLHFFTKDLALRALQDAGYEVLDYTYTPRAVEIGGTRAQRLLRFPRRACFALHRDLAARLLGGYDLLVLAT